MKSSLHNAAIGPRLKELSTDIMDENKHFNLLLSILGEKLSRWYDAYEIITPATAFDLAARYNAREEVYLGNYQMILDGLIKDYTLTINTYSGNNVKLATKAIVEQYVDKTWFSEIFLSAPISPDSKIGDIKVEDDESSDESIIEDDVILEFKVL